MKAIIKRGAEHPQECRHALSVFMQSFRTVPYYYQVKKGDTLSQIAETYLGHAIDYVQLADYNELENPNLIHEDQLIKIPSEHACKIGVPSVKSP